MKKNQTFNVASYLPHMAEKMPTKKAVVFSQKGDSTGGNALTHLTFSQLNEESSLYASGLHKLGIEKGQRALLMVKPSPEFITLAFALFRMGAIPILIDPGMGLSNLLKCIKKVEPDALIAIPIVHFIKTFRRKIFLSIKNSITVGRKFFWEGTTLKAIREKGISDFLPVETKKDDPAAILFTSGSTGIPKGVLYQHGMFMAQVERIKSHYGICETDVDMPTFPLFALFSAAIGMTCVIPDMDPTKPAKVDPKKIVSDIKKYGVTTSFGSPAIWNRVGEYCVKHSLRLPSIKRILMAGAPVPEYVLKRFKNILSDNADTFTPYGATEALPIASISGTERLKTEAKSRAGAGTCVGKPLVGITIIIIKITDDPIPEWKESLLLKRGEKGEIVVKGDSVTREYFRMKEQTALAKISDDNTLWHRMGDIGYFDKNSRLWFCGRKDHKVITKNNTLFTIPCEAIFNRHPDVFRSALVGIGPKKDQQPIIIIEPKKGEMPRFLFRKQFVKELLEISRRFEHTKDITDVLFYQSFPVDIRHNVKVRREKLAQWAKKKMENRRKLTGDSRQ
jgi:acyl-CoA synthetase (AMP-forming)/AMP-acid ligase II